MKILVTGGAGFIGSHVVDEYIAAGHEVIIVDDLSSGRQENVNPKARFYHLDMRSPQMREVIASERPEVINHHAAQIDVRLSMKDPRHDADLNILSPIDLAGMAIEYGVRKFIHISSGGAVYGEPVYLPCDEKHPVQPLCFYGASKYTFELYLYIFKQSFGLDYSILRYPNVYGPRQDPYGEAGVVAIFTGQMLQNQPVTINGTGEQVRDFVYVRDCARANLFVLNSGSGRVYNLGSSQGTSINEIFARLKAITGYQQEAAYGPAKPGETFRIYLDAGLVQKELGWQPNVNLADGLASTVQFFKDREGNW